MPDLIVNLLHMKNTDYKWKLGFNIVQENRTFY